MSADEDDHNYISPTGRLSRRPFSYPVSSSDMKLIDVDFADLEERVLAHYGARGSSKSNLREDLIYGFSPQYVIMDEVSHIKPSGWEPEKRNKVSAAPKLTLNQKEKLRLKRKKERQNKRRARNDR